jgi:hypothetical protein
MLFGAFKSPFLSPFATSNVPSAWSAVEA